VKLYDATVIPESAVIGEVVGKHPAVAKVLDEMSVALEAWMKARA
jgi:hypothetical protein